MGKNLIVYFSRRGENYWDGTIRTLAEGNTAVAARFVQKAVGGDLFEVEPVRPYAADYYACTDEAKRELRDGARPQIKAAPDSLDGYDTIFVGYPNWWGTMPMAMFTFLERYDLSGKRIAPFCTNEGSGLGSSERDLRRVCAGADIVPGLAVRGSETARSERVIADWAVRAAGGQPAGGRGR